MSKKSGPLHEADWEIPTLTTIPTHGNLGFYKEPDPLHEDGREQQLHGTPLESSKPEETPSVAVAQHRCQKWMDKQISPLHEPVKEQHVFVPSGSIQKETEKRGEALCQPQGYVSSRQLFSKATALESYKQKPSSPLSEAVWKPPTLDSKPAELKPPVNLSPGSSQKVRESDAVQGLDQSPLGPVFSGQTLFTPVKSVKEKESHPVLLQETVSTQPPRGSSQVEIPPSTASAITFHKEGEKDSFWGQPLDSSQSKQTSVESNSFPKKKERHTTPLPETPLRKLTMGSPVFLATPLVSIPPAHCQKKLQRQENPLSGPGSFYLKQNSSVAVKDDVSQKEMKTDPLQAPVWYRLNRQPVPLHEPAWD